ncbi:MAG TPA: stage II sporulation protein M [Anaerolineales bacterium]|nr:stage II sporulation protein M [Anaerolineales bacterium]
MDPDPFIRARRGAWQELEDLLAAAQRSNDHLSPDRIDRLGALYRAAGADLAVAQRDFQGKDVTAYLNRLVAQAHAVVYRGRPLAWGRLRRFVTHGFPRVYRQTWPFTLAAALMFFLPALLAGLVVWAEPAAAGWLLPPEVRQLEEMMQEHALWTQIPIEERPYVSSFIMRNNIQVSFLAFGLGVLGGVFTLWVLVLNGLILGGITGLAGYYGLAFDLWTFVIGHGVVELSVIFMAGGAGLSLGWALLRPGLLRRRDALALAARRSVRLVIGAVPLLVIAGLIEGFLSPAETVPWGIKWGVGVGSGVMLYSYLLFGGKEAQK